MRGLEHLRRHGLTVWRFAERGFDAAAGSALNPLRHLGAIGFLAFWALAASGIVLYIVLDTSVDGAYRSIAALDEVPFSGGVLLRGLHRYAADTLVVAMGLHLLREWLHGHEHGFRRYSWLTGVPLVGFVFAAAIGGFWINWDQLGQFSAIATAEWLDALPLLATPLARNFLGAGTVSDRLFSLFIFVHLGVPLLLLFGLWFHVRRITHAAVLPPRPVALGVLAALAAMALAAPVRSHAPAALAAVPELLRLDWIVLFAHPLTYATSPAFVWVLAGGAMIALFVLPFLPAPARTPARAPVAIVDPASCNGCRRCLADCPYAAITMVPHPRGRRHHALAVVDADLCASCGICAGACPPAKPVRDAPRPVRDAPRPVTGIDMPQLPIADLHARVHAALSGARAAHPIVVFGCDHGARAGGLGGAGVHAFSLLCIGQLPPWFVERALRDGAAGVLVAACRAGGCEFRFGERWMRDRLERRRQPRLRRGVASRRLEIAFAGRDDTALLERALERLRRRVQRVTHGAEPGPGASHA
ncbi:MAG: hydrogenase iron-sulfur subunit [Burkholderiales bacterium]|nr:hydrogenase iron-sulfur subunit [Burkholderiales bacterium]